MSDGVDWELAKKVAVKIANRDQGSGTWYYDAMRREFDELTAKAEVLVADETGLVSAAGPARARVADRAMWIDANIASFQRLMRPIIEALGDESKSDGPLAKLTESVGAVQVGSVLGWMSTRVLGQYDLLLTEDEDPDEQDIVYYVGPNVLALEQRNNFDARQFRLWLALHETTHRAQFTGVPWLRDHFVSLVNQTLDSVDPDPKRMLDAARSVVEARRRGEDAMADGGLPALLASPEQREVLDQIMGMMSLLEGHGDVTMDRAGVDEVPGAAHFSSVLSARRNSSKGVAKLMQRLLGIEAKINQYAAGERFIDAVEAQGGQDLLNVAWTSADHLPSMDEIKNPELWIARNQPELDSIAG